MNRKKRIGILTAGGYPGLLNEDTVDLAERNLSGHLTMGGTILGTERAFGFDAAVEIAVNAIDRLNTPASSHNRIPIAETPRLPSGLEGKLDVFQANFSERSVDSYQEFQNHEKVL